MTALAELVVASTVCEGDEICVSERFGFAVVSEVSIDERGRVEIIYFRRGEDAWSKGWQRTSWIVERAIRPLAVDELVLVHRGDADRADEIRLAMQYEREERFTKALQS